jgi:hypothetical protein
MINRNTNFDKTEIFYFFLFPLLIKYPTRNLGYFLWDMYTTGKLSLHFKIVLYGKTSGRHLRDRAEDRFRRLIVSFVYLCFVLKFIEVEFLYI